jgi:CO/xanthine dehydrogenase Mo-binding subunit
MQITATDPDTLKSDAAHDYGTCTNEVEFAQGAGIEDLNVETVTSNPLLPTDRKWAIRFRADGTVTIVLGMRDCGRGVFSAYFASLLTARLGVPSQRVRIYYSATLPAVLQTPIPSPAVLHRSDIFPVASAVADTIEEMCDQVIERGRSAFAAMAGVSADDVGFDQHTGRFFVLDRDRSGNILKIAETVRDGSPIMTEFTRKLRRTDPSRD